MYVALAEALDAPIVTCDAPLGHSPGHRARIEHLCETFPQRMSCRAKVHRVQRPALSRRAQLASRRLTVAEISRRGRIRPIMNQPLRCSAAILALGLSFASTSRAEDADASLGGARSPRASRVRPRSSSSKPFRRTMVTTRSRSRAVSGRVVLRGSNGVAAASALNWYLENVARVNVSLPLRPLTLPSPVPSVRTRAHPNAVSISILLQLLHVLVQHGLVGLAELEPSSTGSRSRASTCRLPPPDRKRSGSSCCATWVSAPPESASSSVGPAYLPWSWMGNIDGLGGPLPESWIASHAELERRILARERALGMTPVLQGFTGHVPPSTAAVFPHATLHKTGNWSAGFGGTWFLDPLDPLFQRFGRRFIERQTELFGTSLHYYAADSFNEINPPTDDPSFLASMSKAVFASMRAADPDAVWVLQGWFLDHQASFWKQPQARALIGAVPRRPDDRPRSLG